MKTENPSWNEFYSQGILYMRTAEKSVRRTEIFTPVIIYNVTAIAIEKLLMGACLSGGQMPFCHTLSGMADYAKNIIGLDEQLVNDMNVMDGMQMICLEESFSSKEPEIEDVPFFIDVMKRVYNQTELHLKSGV